MTEVRQGPTPCVPEVSVKRELTVHVTCKDFPMWGWAELGLFCLLLLASPS